MQLEEKISASCCDIEAYRNRLNKDRYACFTLIPTTRNVELT